MKQKNLLPFCKDNDLRTENDTTINGLTGHFNKLLFKNLMLMKIRKVKLCQALSYV